MTPPVAKVVPTSATLFSDTRQDPYAWLRDRKDPDTVAYLEAENAYTQHIMAPTAALQETLYSEMLGRIQQTDVTVPMLRDGYFYYTRTEEGKQYAIYCRKRGSLDAAEEVLLDGNVLAEGQVYFRVGNFVVSPNGRLLAYSTDVLGDETYTIRVKDLASGALLPDEIPNTYYSLEWAADSGTFFYSVLDEALRPYKVFRHRLGESEDALVHHEEDERFTVEIAKTSSREFLLVNIHSSLTSEVRCIRAAEPDAAFAPILARTQGVEYDVTHHGDHFYIRTNHLAKTFRVLRSPVVQPAAVEEFLPARPGITVEHLRAFRDHLVIEERDQGLTQVHIHHFPTGERHRVAFDEAVYHSNVAGNAEYDTRVVRFSYTSLVTPESVFDYDMVLRARELKKQLPVLGYDASLYASERLQATAPDGTQVPISLVYKKGFKQGPILLDGYGAYGLSHDPVFKSDRLSLLDRGFAYAIAHIRGGADLGKPWHEDGRMLTKRNTFTDFIACAEHLIAQGRTSREQLAITGGSAGGLLMGAVLNMRPDLFAAVVTRVPFVDALNTELDATLPLTIGEWEEWGNPAEEKYYWYIKSYAPYENVREQTYPAMLITAGLNDPRVSYWEPAKWVARLRALKTDGNTLLLKTDMGAGHFGKSGRYEHLKETAFNFAFLLKELL
jgi:oligopeptidase B